MSGALAASTTVGLPITVMFVTAQLINGGNDTASGPSYKVPAAAQVGDTVFFFCIANSMGHGSSPPGSGWANTSGSLGGGNSVYVKKMASTADLNASTTGSGGYCAFTVYRGVVSFAAVSGTGFTKSQYYAGVTFFGNNLPSGATQRVMLNGNGTILQGYFSDLLPPLSYQNGTNYNQYTAVELRSQ